jgi:alpha-beta hydrolase superfamily lysophospholipase
MKTTLERFSTSDGIELHGVIHSPDKPTDVAVLQIHGMVGNFYKARFLDYLALELTSTGYAFAAFNNRGCEYISNFLKTNRQDEESIRKGTAYERFEECTIDIRAAIDLLEKKGYRKIILSGHSMGCSKAVYYQAFSADNRIKALILISPTDMIDHARRQTNFAKLLSIAEQQIKEGKGDAMLPERFWGYYDLSAGTFANYFGKDTKLKIFNVLDKGESILSNIELPILAVIGDMDRIVIKSPEEDMLSLKSLSTRCRSFDYRLIKGAAHSYFGHEMELAEIVGSWVEGVVKLKASLL